jgi:hypothetical protein
MDSTGAQSDDSTWRTQEDVDPRRSAGNSGHHFSDKPDGFRPWRTDSTCNRGMRAERRRVGNATLAIETAVLEHGGARWMRRAPWLPCCASRSSSALRWGDALRAFSDEMRDRRLLRAEERANQLPEKMAGPLVRVFSTCDVADDHPADHVLH